MNRRLVAPALALTIAVAAAVGLQAQGNRPTVGIPAASEILASCQGGTIYATPSGGGLIIGCLSAPTATPSTPTISPTPGPSGTPTITLTPSITPTPDALWWLAGGVDQGDVWGAYRAKGAASYSAALVNLNDPVTHTLAVVGAPTWTASMGWQGDQARHLTSVGARVNERWSVVLRVQDSAQASMQFAGATNGHACRAWCGFEVNNTGGFQDWFNFGAGFTAPPVTNAVLTLAGKDVYIDGIRRTGIVTDPPHDSFGTVNHDWKWMTSNWAGSPHGGNLRTQFWGFALYSDTLTAGQAAAIATAVGGW